MSNFYGAVHFSGTFSFFISKFIFSPNNLLFIITSFTNLKISPLLKEDVMSYFIKFVRPFRFRNGPNPAKRSTALPVAVLNFSTMTSRSGHICHDAINAVFPFFKLLKDHENLFP